MITPGFVFFIMALLLVPVLAIYGLIKSAVLINNGRRADGCAGLFAILLLVLAAAMLLLWASSVVWHSASGGTRPFE